jgi:hypothetical protein
MSDDVKIPKHPKYGWCAWCRRPIRKYSRGGDFFCTQGCTLHFANAAIRAGLKISHDPHKPPRREGSYSFRFEPRTNDQRASGQ